MPVFPFIHLLAEHDNQRNKAQCVKEIYAQTSAISEPVWLIQQTWRHISRWRVRISDRRKTPTVYTLMVDRSFVSASGGAWAWTGSSARATCRNCSSKSPSVPSIANETFNGPSVLWVGPPPGIWYVSVCVRVDLPTVQRGREGERADERAIRVKNERQRASPMLWH